MEHIYWKYFKSKFSESVYTCYVYKILEASGNQVVLKIF